jgi:hypothetical protein
VPSKPKGPAVYTSSSTVLKIVTIVKHAHGVASAGGVTCEIWPKNPT